MRTQDAITQYGSVAKLAEVLGISNQAVYQWGDVVPKGTAYRLQVVSAGALRVDPSLYPKPARRGVNGSAVAQS